MMLECPLRQVSGEEEGKGGRRKGGWGAVFIYKDNGGCSVSSKHYCRPTCICGQMFSCGQSSPYTLYCLILTWMHCRHRPQPIPFSLNTLIRLHVNIEQYIQQLLHFLSDMMFFFLMRTPLDAVYYDLGLQLCVNRISTFHPPVNDAQTCTQTVIYHPNAKILQGFYCKKCLLCLHLDAIRLAWPILPASSWLLFFALENVCYSCRMVASAPIATSPSSVLDKCKWKTTTWNLVELKFEMKAKRNCSRVLPVNV